MYLLVRNILVATKGSVQTHDSNENSSRDEPGFTIERWPPLSPEDRVMLNEGGGRAGWRGGGGRGQKWRSKERLDAPSICKCNVNVV